MANTASTNNRNVNEIAKFKFFKKRRQNLHAHGPSDSTSYNVQHSQSFSRGANSSAENSRNSRRKILDSQPLNSFKGFLKDSEENDKTQCSTNEHNLDLSDITDDGQNNLYPKRPNIDLRKCVPIYYISWIRDQLLYGNCNISISNSNERKVEEILHCQKIKIENLKKHPDINNSNIEILRLLYSRHMALYKSYLNLVREPPSLNRFSSFATTNGVYIRMVKMDGQGSSLFDYNDIDIGNFSQIEGCNLTHDSIIANFIRGPYDSFGSQAGTNESSFYIDEHHVEGPTFINSSHLPSNKSIPMEFLPLKMGKEYLGDWCESWYRKEAIAQSLWDRATKELIIVKALVNIQSIPLTEFEVFLVNLGF